ncbi:hypothetical protein D3C74_392730 [compost metagenome]
MLDGVRDVRVACPASAGDARDEVDHTTVEALPEEVGGQGRLVLARPRRVGEGATQGHRGVQRRGDGEELLAEGEGSFARRAQHRLETLLSLREGGSARPAHQPSLPLAAALAAPAPAASSSSRKRSTTRD